MSIVIAKAVCTGVHPIEGGAEVTFIVDADEKANDKWATGSPALGMAMPMRKSTADQFAVGQKVTLTLEAGPMPEEQ